MHWVRASTAAPARPAAVPEATEASLTAPPTATANRLKTLPATSDEEADAADPPRHARHWASPRCTRAFCGCAMFAAAGAGVLLRHGLAEQQDNFLDCSGAEKQHHVSGCSGTRRGHFASSKGAEKQDNVPGCSGTFEVEDATFLGGVLSTSASSFSGAGFLEFHQHHSGQSIEWTIEPCERGWHELGIRYSLKSENRSWRLRVNSVVEADSWTFPATGAWDTWRVATQRVWLLAGTNTITISTNSFRGNIDGLAIPVQNGKGCFGTFEAENATYVGGVAVAPNSNFGSSGTGYVTFINPYYIEWAIESCTDGFHDLSITYALAAGNRPVRLTVNSVVEAHNWSFPATGAWDTWRTATRRVTLSAGPNLISIRETGYRIANIDKLTVSRAEGHGVAILVAGTLVRYFPNLDRHVVAPLARRGHTADVYLSLSVEGFDSWRSSGNRFVMHPEYQGMSLDDVKSTIVAGIQNCGGNVGAVRMPALVTLTPHGQTFVNNGSWWAREESLFDAQGARTNVAKMYRELDELWTLAKRAEVDANERYTYVMIFRDDANWLFDFDLDRLLRTGGSVKKTHHVALNGSAGRAFGLQREGFDLKPFLCDFVIIAEREVAEPFGSFYHLMTTHLHDPLDYHSSENYMFEVAQAFNVRWEHVPSALIPFVRSGRLNISGSTVLCQHKHLDNTSRGVPVTGADVLIPGHCENLAE